MMKNVHLAPEADEDDLYSGYNDYNPTFDTEVKRWCFLIYTLAPYSLDTIRLMGLTTCYFTYKQKGTYVEHILKTIHF